MKKDNNTGNKTDTDQKYITLNIMGDEYHTYTNKKFEKHKAYKPADPTKIKAFMPGIIRKIYAKKGTKVKEGSKILVLEAMKMNNILFSPAKGVIKKINAKEGQMVPKDFVLAEIDIKD